MALPPPEHLLATLDRDYLPHLSVNGVILGADAGVLRVLLLRLVGTTTWALPAAYVRRDEGIDEAAGRMVREYVGEGGAELRQFHAFGAPDRVGAALADVFQAIGAEPRPGHWALGRVVSVGYMALVDAARTVVTTDALVAEHRWAEVGARPPLLLDHDAMVDRALESVRAGLDALPLGRTLLADAFTMAELQRLYETVLGRPLDRRNFQKRMLELALVERRAERRTGGRHRPPQLYRWIGGGVGRPAGER